MSGVTFSCIVAQLRSKSQVWIGMCGYKVRMSGLVIVGRRMEQERIELSGRQWDWLKVFQAVFFR